MAWREAGEGEQPVARLLEAVGDGAAFQAPFADERLAPGLDLAALLFDDWFDAIEDGVRSRVRGFIEAMLEAELSDALSRPGYGRRRPENDEATPSVPVDRRRSRGLATDSPRPRNTTKGRIHDRKRPVSREEFFVHKLPFDRSLTRWRQGMGE